MCILRNSLVLLVVGGLLSASSATALATIVGPGAPNYDSINAVLSDFQQSYGQVVGDEFTLSSSGQITSLTVWGLYYNYKDLTFTPPVADDFTLRLHQIVSGDPEEAFYLEESLGAGTRTDTGEAYYGLTIYRYDFDGLNIPVDSGTTLLSVIDNTVEPATNGYWHWVSANDDGMDWWRREDKQPVGEENTYYWVPGDYYVGDRAFSMNVVPEPVSFAVWGLILVTGLFGWRRCDR